MAVVGVSGSGMMDFLCLSSVPAKALRQMRGVAILKNMFYVAST